mgnify:CR=1 FL=1
MTMHKPFKKIIDLKANGKKGKLYHGYTPSNKVLNLTRDAGWQWYVIELDQDCVTKYRPIKIDNVRLLLDGKIK